jgi:hypothetical protein
LKDLRTSKMEAYDDQGVSGEDGFDGCFAGHLAKKLVVFACLISVNLIVLRWICYKKKLKFIILPLLKTWTASKDRAKNLMFVNLKCCKNSC